MAITWKFPALWCQVIIPFLEKIPEGLPVAQKIRCRLSVTNRQSGTITIETDGKAAAEALLDAIIEGRKAFEQMEKEVGQDIPDT